MNSIYVGLIAGTVACAFFQVASAGQAANATETVIHSFGGGTDGADPEAGLINVNGTLYGTTYGGGGTGCDQNFGCGTVFALDPKTGAEYVVYSFCRQQNCADGQYPFAGLIYAKGTLYGTTDFGGTYDLGTVFQLDPQTGAETVLHSFGSGTDGFTPFGSLIDVEGTLYGTTEGGGTGCVNPGCGTVYSLDPKTGAEAVIYSFCSQQHCTDGTAPESSLIDVHGTLYGTTFNGGSSGCGGAGCGSVFALDPKTGAETVTYAFCNHQNCKDGRWPSANLIEANGTLYGTTTRGMGRAMHGGTVFALDPNTGAETVLYSFCRQQSCTDGAFPYAGLIDTNGTLYGTTVYGGDRGCRDEGCSRRVCYGLGCGTVFALDSNTGAETVLYSFCRQQNCTDGELPETGLIEVNGTLYGTTLFGGTSGEGTVFSVVR